MDAFSFLLAQTQTITSFFRKDKLQHVILREHQIQKVEEHHAFILCYYTLGYTSEASTLC